MFMRSVATGLTAFLFVTPALAAPTVDLEVDIVTPAASYVYDTTSYDIIVSNLTNKRASDVELSISLPETNTSPTVHVMGTLGAIDPRCTPTGTELVCTIGKLGRNKSTIVSFDIALPQADQVLDVVASVTTSNPDSNPANDSDVDVASLLAYTVDVQPGDSAHNRHCTGQDLTSFFECTLYAGSISEHDIDFLGGGELSIVGQVDYSGTWFQPTPESLVFSYETGGNVVAEFEGYGSSPDCFEGITTFPGSAYMAPYEVCL